jgi:hypothetical protein
MFDRTGMEASDLGLACELYLRGDEALRHEIRPFQKPL